MGVKLRTGWRQQRCLMCAASFPKWKQTNLRCSTHFPEINEAFAQFSLLTHLYAHFYKLKCETMHTHCKCQDEKMYTFPVLVVKKSTKNCFGTVTCRTPESDFQFLYLFYSILRVRSWTFAQILRMIIPKKLIFPLFDTGRRFREIGGNRPWSMTH